MIDDKKIEEAQDEIFEDKFLFNGTDVIYEDGDKEEMYDRGQVKEAISLGAKWAINEFNKNLWHPASEMPKVCVVGTCIIELEGDYYNGRKFEVHDYHKGCGFSTSKGWLDNDKIIQWAYLSDILPKQKGGNHD